MADCLTRRKAKMNDIRKRHYPADRDKLHALCERLEAEIAERQERLAEVRKLAVAADMLP